MKTKKNRLVKVFGLLLLAAMPLSACNVSFSTDKSNDNASAINGKDGNDGKDGTDGSNGKDGNDGTDGKDGKDGVSVVSIVKTGSQGLVDTYTITYSDGTTSTFIVTNGKDGENGVQGVPGSNGHTPVITVGANGNWFVDGADTGVAARGPKGDPGQNGKSAYELYCEAHPEYQGDEDQWLDDLINGRLGNKEVHTVHFETLGGTEIPDQKIYHGEKIVKPADPVKEDYKFIEWTYEDQPWVFFGYVVTEDMTLTAKYEKIIYFDGYYDEFESHNYDDYEYPSKLHELMVSTHSNFLTRGQVNDYYQKTTSHLSIDQISTDIEKNEMFYTGRQVNFDYNPSCEEVWSYSRGFWNGFSSATGAGGDLFNIRPVTSGAELFRSDAKFKEFSAAERNDTADFGDEGPYYMTGLGFDINTEHCHYVEPADAYKGDVARILAYVYIHYNNFNDSEMSVCGDLSLRDVIFSYSYAEACSLLVEWNELDPVSDIEKLRNETVYGIQGNRNPFVDHPEYMARCFGEGAQPDDTDILNGALNTPLASFGDDVVSPFETLVTDSVFGKRLVLITDRFSFRVQGLIFNDVEVEWSIPDEHVETVFEEEEYFLIYVSLEDDTYLFTFTATFTYGDTSIDATYKIAVGKYPYEYEELSLADVYEINDDNNDYKLVDHSTGRYVPNNDGLEYLLVKVTGKVVYVSYDHNFAIIADGDYALEIYGGNAGLSDYPEIALGNTVSVYGELSSYYGNVQLNMISKVKVVGSGSVTEPTLYTALDEEDLVGKHYWEDGLSNSLHRVTGTYIAGSLSKDLDTLNSHSRFTFSILVGETAVKVSYDYHCDKNASLGLFDALKSMLTDISSEDMISISGSLRFDGQTSDGFMGNSGSTSWSIVPLEAEHIGQIVHSLNQQQALDYANEFATNMGGVEVQLYEDPDIGNYYCIEINDSVSSLENLKALLVSYLPNGFVYYLDWTTDTWEEDDVENTSVFAIYTLNAYQIDLIIDYGPSISGFNIFISFFWQE